MPPIEEPVLRRCGPGDAEALALVGAATFLEALSGLLRGPDILAHCRVHHDDAVYARWLDDPAYRICAAEVRHAPVGYAVLAPPDLPVETMPTDLELKRIYLLHRYQGRGLGRRLLQWAVSEARATGAARLLLGVNVDNAPALAFYERAGFLRVGARRFQVGSELCSDHVMALAL